MGLKTSSPNLLINVFKMFALNGNFYKIYNLNRHASVSFQIARQTKDIVYIYIHMCVSGCARFSLWVGEYVCMYEIVRDAEQLPSLTTTEARAPFEDPCLMDLK